MTNKQKGFTLIELLLAMAFIAFMLLFITNAILQATKLYSKGSAIRQIHQTSRQIISDLTRSVRYSKPTYVLPQNRLCVGGTSYIWNIEGSTPPKNVYAAPNTGDPLRLISLQDPTGSLCNSPYSPINKTNTKDLVGNEATVLKFAVSQKGSLWDVALVLSTVGSNVAHPDVTTPTGFSCDADNQFCSFGDFETSIYSRTEGN